VVISNCVISLSADKRRVLGEAFRLKPDGASKSTGFHERVHPGSKT
jgi:hypothetical protein